MSFLDQLFSSVSSKDGIPVNGVTDPRLQDLANGMQKILDSLSFLDTEINKPLDVNYVKHFRKLQNSIIIMARPGELEKRAGRPFACKYTCDDFVVIEYDTVANNVEKAIAARCDDQLTNMIDSKNGLVIIEN